MIISGIVFAQSGRFYRLVANVTELAELYRDPPTHEHHCEYTC